jgi:hypothetical protein
MNGMLTRLTRNYKKKNERIEKRLSNKNISPYGGIATSFAFFVTTMFLGKAEQDFVTIGNSFWKYLFTGCTFGKIFRYL